MKKTVRALSVILALILLMSTMLVVPASAAEPATRTVMMYCVASSLESVEGFATENLIQAMEADHNENLSFIVITGGTTRWRMPSEYLSGAESISTEINQVWRLEGKRSGEEHGKMILCEPDGITDAPITEPSALTAFVDYCYVNYPADIYDLIMWDHGEGPVYGFGYDMNNNNKMLSLKETVQAFGASRLVRDGKRFDMINYDACLMSSVEVIAALCDYADSFVCSAQEEPGGGEDYTLLMDALNSDLSIGGFDLGKQMVDAFVAKYDIGSTGNTLPSTLSVIDAGNFKTRLLPLLDTLSEILLSEAKNTGDINGKYNFYDELYSEYAAYENGSDGYYDLFDLGNLLSALGCWQTEADNLPADAIENYRNAYTAVAVQILSVLADDDNSGDDVIYSSSTSDMNTLVRDHNLRAADGSLAAYNDEITYEQATTGLSIFYPSLDIIAAYDYQDVMTELVEALPSGSARTFLERYISVVTYYGLINSLGSAVSELALDGDVPAYDDVKAKLQDDGLWEDYHEEMLGCLVACGEFASLDEAEEFFADIAAQQSAEAVTKEKTAVMPIRNDSDKIEGYTTETSQTSAHTLTGAGSYLCVATDPNDTGFKMYLSYFGYSYFMRQIYFPDGFVFNLNNEKGVMDTAYGASDVGFSIKRPSDICLVLYDADGGAHIADAIYIDKERTEAAVPIVTYENYLVVNNYYLYVKKTGNSWQVEGVSAHLTEPDEREYIPMDSDIFAADEVPDTETWIAFTTVSKLTDAFYGETHMIPTSNFTDIDNTVANWGLTVKETALVELGLTPGRYYYLTDVYGNEIDISELMNDAGEGDLIDISAAEVTVTVDDGTPVVTVVLGDDVLTENVDYIVIFGTDENGKAQAKVIGIGNYTGSKICIYSDPEAEYEYTVLIDGTAAIERYNGIDTELVIPSHLNGHTVSAIGNGAFFFESNLQKVTIPDTVTSIGEQAFVYCESLTEVDLGNGVTQIGGHAFDDCDLRKLVIPDSVQRIGEFAFSDNKHLTEVTIGKGLTEIPKRAFFYCGLTSLHIPKNITSIGDYAFMQNPALTEVYIPSTVTELGVRPFGYLDKAGTGTLVEGFTIIGKAGSAAQAYAESEGIPFREATELMIGDADGDGIVTISDVTAIQKKLAECPSEAFNEKAADVDGNGLDIIDATAIQRYLAELDDPYHIGEYTF